MNEKLKAGADIHAGDGGYSIGTQEKYDEFVKGRNQSLAKARLEDLIYQAGLTGTTYTGENEMKLTRPIPRRDTTRTRRVFALLPHWFDHGPLNEPLRTMVWLDYYLVEERWSYCKWEFMGRKLEE